MLGTELGNTSSEAVWIGLNDIEVDGNYKWLDESLLSRVLYRLEVYASHKYYYNNNKQLNM